MGQQFLVTCKDDVADPLRWVMEKNSNQCIHLGQVSLDNSFKDVGRIAKAAHLINILGENAEQLTWQTEIIDYLERKVKERIGYVPKLEFDSLEFEMSYEEEINDLKKIGHDPLKILKY
tara:strand:- start:3 stop:359 length:357 start_codon:yes stop_codon:yes gene_type:complete